MNFKQEIQESAGHDKDFWLDLPLAEGFGSQEHEGE